MHIPEKIEGLKKSSERIDLEMQYLRLCGVYGGKIIQEFVNDLKINPNASDRFKNNALMYALRPISYGVNKLDTIKTLCKMGVSPTAQNIFGFSPLSLTILMPMHYGFCVGHNVTDASYTITLSDHGNKYTLNRRGSNISPKTLDFPYPINMLNLLPSEKEILCSGVPMDIILKSYEIKIKQQDWFLESREILQENFKSLYKDKFINSYINIYLKKKLKILLWGFGEDYLEVEENELFK